ncbi:MAG: hypothetical protein ABIB72_01670 [Candidatus Falkowbacteria bacterium]
MKKISVLVATLLVLALSGCAPAIQIGVGLIGEAIGSGLSKKSAGLVLGEDIEKHRVGEYEVVVSDGFYKKNPSVIFAVYLDGRGIQSISFDKKDSDDIKTINNFNRMSETGKKQLIRDWFIKYARLDLGPIEPEIKPKTAEKSPAPSFSPNIPISLAPSFSSKD